MQTFVKINLGDIVFDKESRSSGKVTYIDFKQNTAKVEVIIDTDKVQGTRTTKLLDVRLSNLIMVEKSKKKSVSPNKQWNMVRLFHKLFGHPIAEKPTPVSLERMTSRSIWTVEEVIETLHASASNQEEFLEAVSTLIGGVEKAVEKSLKEEFPTNDIDRIVAQADGLIDGLYFLNGSLVELGVKPDKLFEAVQNSNLSKLFTDEKGNKFAKYREEDGKILKNPDWTPPEPAMRKEVERQLLQ